MSLGVAFRKEKPQEPLFAVYTNTENALDNIGENPL
jgi:hypothetical protein